MAIGGPDALQGHPVEPGPPLGSTFKAFNTPAAAHNPLSRQKEEVEGRAPQSRRPRRELCFHFSPRAMGSWCEVPGGRGTESDSQIWNSAGFAVGESMGEKQDWKEAGNGEKQTKAR